MDCEYRRARGIVRQVDEKDLVEASLANQLRRQTGDVVGGGDYENPRPLLREPGQESAEYPARSAAVTVAVGERLFDFVDPQHTRRERFSRCERLPQVLFRLG